MRGVIQRIFSDHFGRGGTGRGYGPHQRKAIRAIRACRTSALGGHVEACPDGHVRKVHYNSCKHRSCPQCGSVDTQNWLGRQLALLPACDYYHVIFTCPHDVNILWKYNRRLFIALYFRAAWHSLRDFLADPRWLGALPGALGAVHTWDQALGEHIHLHFLVTAGGVTPGGQWKPVAGKYLVYAPALSAKFRGKFIAYLRKTLEKGDLCLPPGMSDQHCHNLLNKVSQYSGKKWHVQIQPRYRHGGGILKYLARYLRGGPISENRITGYDRRTVTIRRKKRDSFEGQADGQAPEPAAPILLTREQFVQRFLSHVPPGAIHTVRSFGLLHPGKREAVNAVRAQLHQEPYTKPPPISAEEMLAELPGPDPRRCPVCGKRLVAVQPLPATRSPPPRQKAAA